MKLALCNDCAAVFSAPHFDIDALHLDELPCPACGKRNVCSCQDCQRAAVNLVLFEEEIS